MDKFSRRGDEPTQFELDLVAQADTTRITDAQGQWLILAQRYGLAAILGVMDEFGRDKVRVPSREDFLIAVWRPQRNELIRAAMAQGVPLRQLRAEFGLSNSSLMRARNHHGVDVVTTNPVNGRR